jgi:hypothetical protein
MCLVGPLSENPFQQLIRLRGPGRYVLTWEVCWNGFYGGEQLSPISFSQNPKGIIKEGPTNSSRRTQRSLTAECCKQFERGAAGCTSTPLGARIKAPSTLVC